MKITCPISFQIVTDALGSGISIVANEPVEVPDDAFDMLAERFGAVAVKQKQARTKAPPTGQASDDPPPGLDMPPPAQ